MYSLHNLLRKLFRSPPPLRGWGAKHDILFVTVTNNSLYEAGGLNTAPTEKKRGCGLSEYLPLFFFP